MLLWESKGMYILTRYVPRWTRGSFFRRSMFSGHGRSQKEINRTWAMFWGKNKSLENPILWTTNTATIYSSLQNSPSIFNTAFVIPQSKPTKIKQQLFAKSVFLQLIRVSPRRIFGVLSFYLILRSVHVESQNLTYVVSVMGTNMTNSLHAVTCKASDKPKQKGKLRHIERLKQM